MHLTFILPAVGHKPGGATYPKTWIMEPLSIAVLSRLTPPDWGRTFFDDRLGEIDFDRETDAVCISVECYTAKRSYQIAEEYRKRGRLVIMGGFQASLAPEEVALHADAVIDGQAENVWGEVLSDLKAGTLKRLYRSDEPVDLAGKFPDRSIFGGRDYGILSLVETSRGCRFHCEFCSITVFFRQTYRARPIEDVVREIRGLKKKNLFFVDDNLAMDVPRLKELCLALKPLKKRWIAQLSIHTAQDRELLRLMRDSGCAGVLIGFESLQKTTLRQMGKSVNEEADMVRSIRNLREFGISIYATFVFGYDDDTPETFEKTLRFAIENKFFFAAFNHLVPFPGTQLFERLKQEGRLLDEHWWLDEKFVFGDVVFRPAHFTPEELAGYCQTYRRKFYSFSSILRRGLDPRANCRGLFKALLYFISNFSQSLEVGRRRGLPFGDPEE
jgi:radical SAM superfamily enzyme YgiQ (UPF0313 family)